MIEEPVCNKAPAHDWQELGVEDNGETVHRCGNCLTRRYSDDDEVLRYEVAQ